METVMRINYEKGLLVWHSWKKA